MSRERPKILTAVTVPTGGWDLDFTISLAASLDTPLTATVAAGTYFVAWDAQDDDLLYTLNAAMEAQLGVNGDCNVYIDSDRKVRIKFSGFVDSVGWENDVEINWTTSDAGLAQALGADYSADWTSTGTDNPTWTADYQHAYGWYATEDGQLEFKPTEDFCEAVTAHARALDGTTYGQLLGNRYTSELSLGFLTEAQTWSDGVEYGSAAVYPYAQNVPLECWWHAIKDGTRFRVYRHDERDYPADSVAEHGTNETASNVFLEDTTRSWPIDPHKFKSMHVVFDTEMGTKRFFINSHNTTRLLSANTGPYAAGWDSTGSVGFDVVDMKYDTYVIDAGEMSVFAPSEIPNVNRYNITIPLLRYVA